jgi:adhesin HecA-like repeat protein
MENVRRKALKTQKVREYKLFGGSKAKFIPYEEIQIGGILEADGDINISADESLLNKGGIIVAENDLRITAPVIENTVQEGTRVVTWDPGNLGKFLGKKSWGYAS